VQAPDWNASGWALAALQSVPVVEQLHAPAPFVSQELYTAMMSRADIVLAAALEKATLQRAAAVVASSQAQARAYRESGWPAGRTVHVIPEAIDWANWETGRSVERTKPIVLFAGFLETRKAPEILVQALQIIRRRIPEAEAVFAGQILRRDGLPYVTWMEREGMDTSGCKFLGHVARDRLREIMSESRVFALPSRGESFGLVAVEAMSAARPVVVTTASGGAAELVQTDGGGAVIPPDDPGALADALLPFLVEPRHASAVGAQASRIVRERLDPQTIAARREVVYAGAVRRYDERRTRRHRPWITLGRRRHG
jgi:glycosyltransferase involved in cell wall biosynthesis